MSVQDLAQTVSSCFHMVLQVTTTNHKHLGVVSPNWGLSPGTFVAHGKLFRAPFTSRSTTPGIVKPPM